MAKRMAWILSVCLLLSGFSVCADGMVMYDEESGESLSALLTEDEAVWPTVAVPAAEGPSVAAPSAVLMDQATGQVLYEKNAREQRPIASVTKVMTLLLVMEALEQGRIKWQDTVTCSDRAASMGGSQIWLESGEMMTVEELVKAAAVVSANDACTALAEHISGTLEAFVAAMNERAAQLGMEHTRFVDCSGLDDSGYSCALDVAVMSRALMTHRDIEKYTTIWMDTLRGGQSQLVNTNKLVRHYSGATGLKTGTTAAAGHCLAATARRENTAFVAVVLGCTTTADRFDGARGMLDYGFSVYETYTPSAASVEEQTVTVRRGQQTQVGITPRLPDGLLVKKGTASQITAVSEPVQDVEAPVEKGQILGTCKLMWGEETLGEYPLVAAHAVAAADFRWAYRLLLSALLGEFVQKNK